MRKPKAPGRNRITMTRRSLFLGGGMGAVMAVLGWRMRQLGVEQSNRFRLLAEENRVNIRLIPPVRGLIFDRRGLPLAYNEPIYKIDMVREQAKDPEAVLRRLATLVPLTDEEIDKALATMKKRRAFVPVTVVQGLNWKHIAAVSANAPALPGISPELGHYRIYPNGGDFAHILGRVGPVSDYDLKKINDKDPLLLIPRFQIGKTGVEKSLDRRLRGEAGEKRIEVNALGRVMRVLSRDESKPGANVQVTIDHRLQKFALNSIEGQSAAVVVMDVNNGDLLAMASAPSYDPNMFVRGISVDNWKALNTDIYKPLLNKTVTGLYPPGSTYKMVSALAALEGGFIKPAEKIFCGGYVEVYNQRFHCWKRGGHGKVDLKDSLKQSCDIYYYELAQRVGIEKTSAMARKLGLGVEHELSLPGVREGLAPTREWKKARKKKDWVVGDSLNAAIGQGYVLASPLQLAVMTARIASGTRISPRLLNAVDDRPQPVIGKEPLDIATENLDQVRQGMYAVVNEQGGTASGSKIRVKGMQMAGKTGTSQVRRIKLSERKTGVIHNKDLEWEERDHALFVGYAPYDKPRFAISVLVEHGGSGSSAAAPVARDVLQFALELGDMAYQAPQKIRTGQQAGTGRKNDKA